MRKIFLFCLAFCCISLTGCDSIIKPYRPPVQQGNVITHDMMQRLKVGMTQDQVVQIFGTPVLGNTFESDTWIYVYTLQPSRGKGVHKQLTINFRNNRVSNFIVGLPNPNPQRKYKK